MRSPGWTADAPSSAPPEAEAPAPGPLDALDANEIAPPPPALDESTTSLSQYLGGPAGAADPTLSMETPSFAQSAAEQGMSEESFLHPKWR